MPEQDKMTLVWRRYEAGRNYNNSLTPNQYNLVHTNVEFFAGNQWLHLPNSPAMNRLLKPVFNIIKRVAHLFVATLTSTGVAIAFESLTDYESASEDGAGATPGRNPDNNLAAFATDEVRNVLDKLRTDYRVREALFDGAQTGDYCAHFYWHADAIPYGGMFGLHRGEIAMELVDGINVMFGNPKDCKVQNQPYILLIGRDTVENLRSEFRRYNGEKSAEWAVDMIQPDSEYGDQAGVGGKTELLEQDDTSGQCLYAYMYEMKSREETILREDGTPVLEPVLDADNNPIQAVDADGKPIVSAQGVPVYKMREAKHMVSSVYVTKATKNAVIYENVDTNLSRYPIAWGNWEKQKNQYHGRALVTGIIPNQIFINTMFAMIMRHLQLQGFPKTVYNADLISQWSNEIGQCIGVRGMQPGQSISQMAYNLAPANMSDAITHALDMVVQYTKECLGATDVQMGNVKPDNTSALMVLQTSSEVPLENTRAALYEWLEDIGAIMLDMMGTYYGKRPIVRPRTFQEPVIDPSTGLPKLNAITGLMETKSVVRRVKENFDFRKFKNLWFNVRADVGASTYFSEIAMVQTLDNLRANGTLDVIQYLERIPDKLIPRRAELIEELKTAAGLNAEQLAEQGKQATAGAAAGAAAAAQMMSVGAQKPTSGGELDDDKAIRALPVNTQARYKDMTQRTKNVVKRMGSMKSQ